MPFHISKYLSALPSSLFPKTLPSVSFPHSMANHSPAGELGGAATTIEDLHPDILTRALRHMDGPTLAAASCATSHLRSLSANPDIWSHLCLSTWPSLRHPRLLQLIADSRHRSFFADAFPFPQEFAHVDDTDLPGELLSAVDLFYRGQPIFSRVVETETFTPWFLGSPFRVDALDRKEPPTPEHPLPAAASTQDIDIPPEELTLSWIVIDPVGGRAINVSSRRPVSVERHWYTGETILLFATVVHGCALGVVVTCGEETGHVREVSMTVEDMDGVAVNGRESLVILKGVMEGGRKGKGEGEAKERYAEYLMAKRRRKANKVRREGLVDFACTAVGVSVFLAFLMMLAFR